MQPAPKLYFGHPVNSYDTPLEKTLTVIINAYFNNQYDIENPNQPIHQEGYTGYKTATGNGMDYFYKEVLPSCAGGIFLVFPDGAWGMGVWGEAQWFVDRDLSIWVITPAGGISKMSPAEFVRVKHLSIEETRARVKLPFNLVA